MLQTDKDKSKIIFIHANGFPPNSYNPLFDNISKEYTIDNFLLRPLLSNKNNHKELIDWTIFQKDFIDTLKNKKSVIGIGHSIGGNIILRTAISNPEKFSKIILLDPTLFIPRIIYGWIFFSKLGLQNKIHPWINSTLNRKMFYDNYDQIFKSYRKKEVFSKINNKNLKIYINSITKLQNNKIHITYSKDWEYQIYKTGLISDMYIWKNIKNLSIPCLIVRAASSNAFLNSSQKKIENLNQKIQFITIKNSSHLFPLEFPDETSDIINDYIDN